MNSNQQVSRRITSLALLVASILLIAGVFLPWASINFSWLSTGGNRGDLHYSLNGIGIGQGYADIYYKNSTYNYTVNTNWQSFLPQVTPLGVLLIGVAIFNIFLAFIYLDEKTRKVLPNVLIKKLTNYYEKLILLEGILSFGVTVVFILFYFRTPVVIPFNTVMEPGIGSNPAHFQTSHFSLFDFYTHVFNYFSWILESSGASKMVLNRSLGPGLGLYLTWLGTTIILYAWYVTFTKKENWPEIWKKRGIVAPLLLMLAFLPVMKIVSTSGAEMPPLLLSPLFYNLGGGLYLILTLAFVYFLRKSALLDRNLNEASSKLYATEEIHAEQLQKLVNKVEQLREKSGAYRRYTGMLNIAILLTVEVIVASIVGYYITFTGETTFGFKIMVHTFWNWVLLLSPIGNTMLFILYR